MCDYSCDIVFAQCNTTNFNVYVKFSGIPKIKRLWSMMMFYLSTIFAKVYSQKSKTYFKFWIDVIQKRATMAYDLS